ncbi:DUF2794 domain-containing protein [Kordiimonas pumila]|uniref:DUF2794 domain-containing protein n=1 Tax=Kordiimonas pumila TaxID=2161677 RepID=A0ABV7D0Z0_9PROT|nr:DUF2794 domain-containing protein [Kordiimonas pumila]
MDDIITLSGNGLKANDSGAQHHAVAAPQKANPTVYFIRHELGTILNIYGRMVAAGMWHDYAIDHMADMAIFSVFRRASEMPLYNIIKEPALANKQGMWRITNTSGQILKRGKDLAIMMRYFDRQTLKAI